MDKKGYVYLLSNYGKTVIYTGVTSDIKKRIYQHKNKHIDGFSKRYHTDILVYYECLDSIEEAIVREKQIKAGSRAKKEALINGINPEWVDLYQDIIA